MSIPRIRCAEVNLILSISHCDISESESRLLLIILMFTMAKNIGFLKKVNFIFNTYISACPRPPNAPQGLIPLLNLNTNFVPGNIVRYTCSDSNFFTTTSQVVCLRNRIWSPPVLQPCVRARKYHRLFRRIGQ